MASKNWAILQQTTAWVNKVTDKEQLKCYNCCSLLEFDCASMSNGKFNTTFPSMSKKIPSPKGKRLQLQDGFNPPANSLLYPPSSSVSFLFGHSLFFTTPTKMVLQMLLKPWLASEVKESLQASQEEQPVSAGVATRSINPLFPLSGWKVNLQYQNTRFILFLTCICLPLIYIVGSPNTRRAMYGNKDKHV